MTAVWHLDGATPQVREGKQRDPDQMPPDRFKGLLAMRLRLSDAATSAVLAEHYRAQAEMCHQMARMTVSPFKEGWLELAAEWTKLAREQEAKAK